MRQLATALLLLAAAVSVRGDEPAVNGSRRLHVWGSGKEEKLIGWKGEQHRPKGSTRTPDNGLPRVQRFGAPTAGDTYAVEDRERGTWMELLSWKPRAFAIHNLMTQDECEELIKIATPMMTRSTVVDSVTGESKVDPIRTSEQTFLNRGQFPLVTKIEERLARYTMLPWQNGEDMQILKYGIGQKYDAHHDVGELSSKSGQQLAADGGYRVATVLLYLTDTEEGGETAFPDSEWADERLAAGSWSECAEGRVAMRSRAGEGLLFWSIMPNNEIDPASMHAGCPVVKGLKWTGTKWLHAEPFRWRAPAPPPIPPGCADKNPTCKAWASMGECKKNPGFMIGEPGNQGACVWSCKACHKFGFDAA